MMIRVAELANLAGTGPAVLTGQAAVRAYGRVDQVTPNLDSAFNVASYSDTASGTGTFNYTNNFASVGDVATVSTSRRDAGGGVMALRAGAVSLSGVTLESRTDGGALLDTTELSMETHGELA